MDLYSHTRSPWCRKVEWALAEMNQADRVPTTVIGLNGADAQAGVIAMKEACGPHTTMPALKVDGWVLTESSAIVFYLADELDYNGTFFPRSFKDRANMQQWDRIADINLGANVLSPWLRNTLFLNGKAVDTTVLEKARENFVKIEDRIEAQLKNSPFLGGQNFSYADIGMAHLLTQLKSVGGPELKSELAAGWLKNCTSRKSYVDLSARNS